MSLSIPKYKLVVLTGPSGSGKSTLAMDTLQRECQRQYMDSMRMMSDTIGKPKVESIEGLSPSISVGQHVTNRNPRSTVGTMTDLYTFVRFIFSKLNINIPAVSFPLGCLVSVTGVSGSGKSTLVFDILAAGNQEMKRKKGCKEIIGLEHVGNIVIFDQSPMGRIQRSNVATYTDVFTHLRQLFAGLPEAKKKKLTSKHFSFNTPGGRCETCQGLGVLSVDMNFLPDLEVKCPDCKGRRFTDEVLQVKYEGYSISDLLNLSVQESLPILKTENKITGLIEMLCEIGLGYLKWSQSVKTLSRGEGQRIRLAKELSKQYKNHTLYLLDEPTTGLHPSDIKQLHILLTKLVDTGNTVVVVEHSLELIRESDWVIDIGPEGGADGGKLVVEGTPEQVAEVPESYTGMYLKRILA